MEWLLSLVLQLVSISDDFSQATMNEPLKAVIQEHVVCRKYFEHHEEEFHEAMRIENPKAKKPCAGISESASPDEVWGSAVGGKAWQQNISTATRCPIAEAASTAPRRLIGMAGEQTNVYITAQFQLAEAV